MLVLMSHGDLATGVVNSAEMIIGELQDTRVITVSPEMNPEQIESSFRETIAECPQGEHLCVMVDMLAGTPCNIAMRLTDGMDHSTLLSGLSLSMVISYALSEETDPVKRKEECLAEAARHLRDITNALSE